MSTCHGWCTSPLLSEEIESIKVPVRNKKSPTGFSIETYPILHPHRILSFLMNDVQLEVPTAEIAEFWRHAREVREPWAVNHPSPGDHIPLGIHGDSARLWTQCTYEKYTAISFNILHFRPKSVRCSRFVVFSIPTAKLFKNRSLNIVWRRLAWSFEALYQGTYPLTGVGGAALRDHNLKLAGRPITRSGHRFALCEFRGDWEWHCSMWRPTASWQSNNVCFKCPAVATGQYDLLYWNIKEPCAWHRQEFGFEQFLSRRLRETNLCTLPYFFAWKCILKIKRIRVNSISCLSQCSLSQLVIVRGKPRSAVDCAGVPPQYVEMVQYAHVELGIAVCRKRSCTEAYLHLAH